MHAFDGKCKNSLSKHTPLDNENTPNLSITEGTAKNDYPFESQTHSPSAYINEEHQWSEGYF